MPKDARSIRSDLWAELMLGGYEPPTTYSRHKTADMLRELERIRSRPGYQIPTEDQLNANKLERQMLLPGYKPKAETPPPPPPAPPKKKKKKDKVKKAAKVEDDYASDPTALAAFLSMTEQAPQPEPEHQPAPQPEPPKLPEEVSAASYVPNIEESPLRTDDEGRVWFREEVRKPATPAPRARRRLTYIDTGVREEKVIDGRYVETVEVAGDRQTTEMVKITMPSYQVGVYLDPRFPFKVHVYNEARGFDLFDVQKFYGGGDLVPPEVLRLYVGNDLCYDIRTTIRAIQSEFRQQQMRGVIQ